MATGNRKTSLRGLRTFCAAAEHSNFRTAAEQLYITASAVSHQVKNLEEEFGTKLFERQGRSLRLTDTGQALFDDIHPLILQLDAATTRHRREEPATELRISVQPFFASEMFVPRLSDFTSEHPNIDIKVDTSDESAEKHPANSDVSIRVFRAPPSGLASERLFSLRLTPAASGAFQKKLKVSGRKISSDFPIIVHESRPGAWGEWQRLSGIDIPATSKTLYLDSMIAVARAAEQGLGAALVPAQLSDRWFESGSLVPLFSTELITDDAYYFVCRHADENRESVRQLREWVLSQFRDEQASSL
jgi:LysR family glycine cleavage system transcriptional activator